MNVRRARFGLYALTAAFGLGTAAELLWGLVVFDPQVPVPDRIRAAPAAARNEAAPEETVPERSEFAPLWETRLRPPLYEPQRPQPENGAEEPERDPLNVKLAATMIEPGRSFAVFRLPGPKIQVRGVGEAVGRAPRTATLLEVRPDRVVLSYGDRRMTLQLERPGGR